MAEEQQQIVKGLEKVEQELKASESDGPVSETFCKVLLKLQLIHTWVAGITEEICV